MNVVKGSLGARGSAWISRDKKLVIETGRKKIYDAAQITSLIAYIDKERKFSFFSCVLGVLFMTILTPVLLKVADAAIAIPLFIGGLVLVVFGSFHTRKADMIDLVFEDGETVTVECTPRGARKLVAFRTN